MELDHEESVYRLRIKNDGVGDLEPWVSVTAILDENRVSLVETSRLPFTLSWSEDAPERTRQVVIKDEGERTIGVFLADVASIEFRGAEYLPDIDTEHHRTILLRLVVRAAPRQQEERWFEIVRDNEAPSAPYRVRGIAPPRAGSWHVAG